MEYNKVKIISFQSEKTQAVQARIGKATTHEPNSPPGFVGVRVGMLVLVVDDTIVAVDGLIPAACIASMIRLRLMVNTPVAVCFVRPELASAEAWSAHAI